MGSYPFIQNGAHGTNLVIRGTDPARLDAAMVRLTAAVRMTPETLAAGDGGDLAPCAHAALGPFTLRDGAGGGKRVSAASLRGPVADADIAALQSAMAQPLFLIRDGRRRTGRRP